MAGYLATYGAGEEKKSKLIRRTVFGVIGSILEFGMHARHPGIIKSDPGRADQREQRYGDDGRDRSALGFPELLGSAAHVSWNWGGIPPRLRRHRRCRWSAPGAV